MIKQSKEMEALQLLLKDTVYGHEYGDLAFVANSTCEALADLRSWIEDLQVENTELKAALEKIENEG